MLQFWQSLDSEAQAVVIGLALSGLFYLGRLIAPGWFADPSNAAKFKRTAGALLSALGLALVNLAATGWPGVGPFLSTWLLAYATAEGAHTVVARTTAPK